MLTITIHNHIKLYLSLTDILMVDILLLLLQHNVQHNATISFRYIDIAIPAAARIPSVLVFINTLPDRKLKLDTSPSPSHTQTNSV